MQCLESCRRLWAYRLRKPLTYGDPCNCPVAEAMVAGCRGRARAASSFLGLSLSLLQQGPAVRRIILWHPLLYLPHPLWDWRPGRACTTSEVGQWLSEGRLHRHQHARPLTGCGWLHSSRGFASDANAEKAACAHSSGQMTEYPAQGLSRLQGAPFC